MSILGILAIAVALSLDAFAVAAGTGCALRGVRMEHHIRLSGAFGFFQFLMPVIGWYLGHTVHDYIEAWDHWIAFALLGWIGLSMLRAGFSAKMRDSPACELGTGNSVGIIPDPTRGHQLLVLAVATSIDALAVGLSFAMIGVGVWWPALVIGVVCAAITSGGLLLGARLAHATIISNRAEVVSGLVLIGIGVNILHEHGVF